jgi:hypothetical protein
MERNVSDRLEMPSITPQMGPFLLKDECGMKAAIALLLDRSLYPGCSVQNSAVRKTKFEPSGHKQTNIAQTFYRNEPQLKR